jgi:glycosyltransferase involved in cell wall biosynthesis
MKLVAKPSRSPSSNSATGSICFLVGNISLSGGTERAVATIASGLAEKGWNVSIVSLRGDSRPFFALHPSIALHTVLRGNERLRWHLVHSLLRLRKIAKACAVDVWVDAETVLSAYSVPALAGLEVRHYSWENFHLHEHLGSVVRPLGRAAAAYFCTGVVVLTTADQQAWLKKFGVKRAIHHIPHCVQRYRPVSKESLRERKNIVLAVGRHCDQKGFDLLLQAWATVCTRHPRWHLRIVGSGELTLELQALSRSLSIENQVEWIAHTNDVDSHYAECSIYALSSRFEGFGIVLIEALTHGLPIVSFLCHHGPEDILADQHCGTLVPNGNVPEFAQALEMTMTDDTRRHAMAHAALQRAEHYAPSVVIAQWERLLRT